MEVGGIVFVVFPTKRKSFPTVNIPDILNQDNQTSSLGGQKVKLYGGPRVKSKQVDVEMQNGTCHFAGHAQTTKNN